TSSRNCWTNTCRRPASATSPVLFCSRPLSEARGNYPAGRCGAPSLFASLIPGDRDNQFSGKNDGTLESAQRIACHADSRTTKLYACRGQKVLLEDMERIRY